MADVIDLRVRRLLSCREARKPPEDGPAEIVLFPGIRYTYHDGARTRARHRDVLELAD